MNEYELLRTFARQTLVEKMAKKFWFEVMDDTTKMDMESYIEDHDDKGEIIWNMETKNFTVKFSDGQEIETRYDTRIGFSGE